MSFLLRATLVIGVLSYCAAHRDDADGFARATPSAAALPALWDALPAGLRERVVREGTAETGRRLVGSLAPPASRDTLDESDRRPAWRGIEGPDGARPGSR